MDSDPAHKSLSFSFKTLPAAEERFLEKISSFERFTIFSPHLDDAVLSMGDLLLSLDRLQKPIDVINVFTQGSPLATPLTKRLLSQGNCNTSEDYFSKRVEEDKKVFEKFSNVFVTHLGLSDAAWRRDGNKKALYPATVLGEIHQYDVAPEELEGNLSKISLILSGSLVFAPLACGNHVDHQIVRNAVTNIFSNVIYYTDYPYILKHTEDNSFVVKNNLKVNPLTIQSIEVKKNIVFGYTSQLESFSHYGNLRFDKEYFYSPSELLNL